MKSRNISRTLSMLLAGIMLLTMSFSVLAADRTEQVELYLPEGEKKNLVNRNGKDLMSFEGAVPGDTLIQNIIIENQRNESVDIFFQTSSIENTALMDLIQLEIVSGGRVVYKGAMSGRVNSVSGTTSTGTAGIPLGTCAARSKYYVSAKLHIPITVDNTYAGATGKVKWGFYAEYKGTSTTSTKDKDKDKDSNRPSGGTDRADSDSERRISQILDDDVPLGGQLYTIPDDQTPIVGLPRTGGAAEPICKIGRRATLFS